VRVREGKVNFKAGELSEEDLKKAEPLIPVFGMELMKKLFSSDWHLREQALQEITDEVA